MAPRKEVDVGLQRFLQTAATHRLLTEYEEKALARRAVAGDESARQELLACNIRLVVSVARHFRNRGLDFMDVIQEGIIGLNRATEKFDPERGYRFSTYATLWIKQAIQRGLSNSGSTIRLPPLVADRRIKARGIKAEFPDWTDEDIADVLEIEVQQVTDALGAAEVVASLDREVQDDESAYTLLDTLTDHDADDPQDVTDWLARSDVLAVAVKGLGTKPRKLIALRFGIGGADPLPLDACAKKLSITRAEAGRMQKAALVALRDAIDST